MNYDDNYLKNLLPNRPENSHKGTFGHVLNVAGSEFYSGAAYFSSVSALKVGCGKATLASEKGVLASVSALSPDIILLPIKTLKKTDLNEFQAISIGCGLSQSKQAVKNFKNVLKILSKSDVPVVIDADGLNILSSFKDLKSEFKKSSRFSLAPCGRGQGEGLFQLGNLILTPHPKEMARLMGVKVETILAQPEFWVRECCKKFNCTTVLKLHKTIVVDNKGHFYENKTGNSALAHGGSGDVLTGMITGFLAQGLSCFEAACLGVFLHGVAGELASKDLTEYSTLASDLINYIPQAIKTIL